MGLGFPELGPILERWRASADSWFAQKPKITAMVQFLGKKYEEYKGLTAIDKLRVIADGGKPYQDKSRTLGKVMRGFLSGWPGENCHDQSRCSLPVHPCCVQRLEKPPSLSASDTRLGKDKWI